MSLNFSEWRRCDAEIAVPSGIARPIPFLSFAPPRQTAGYHRFAKMIGLGGIYVDYPEQMGAAWDQALASDFPVMLEVKTDPEVPPLPPHITLQQAKRFSIALVKGDPDEAGMIRGAAR